MTRAGQVRELSAAAAREPRPEAQVFKPSIQAGNGIEVDVSQTAWPLLATKTFLTSNGSSPEQRAVEGFAHRIRPTYPGFPVNLGGVEELRAALFERKPHARSLLVLRSRKSRQRWGERGAPVWNCGTRQKFEGKTRCIPHLAKNERDAPNFLYAALDRTACAPFF